MAIQRAKPLIKANLKLFLEDLFLRNGFYSNVSAGDTNFYGNDTSRMMPGDIVYPAGSDFLSSIPNKVFQSPFKNWVHEDGIPSSEVGVFSPIVASGVTVDGTFYPTTTIGAFAHAIDFPNGRIIFDAPLAGTPVVQGTFAYKSVLVDGANVFDNENKELLIETAYKDNPTATGVDIYPSINARTLPAIFIDLLRRDNSAYELGNRAPVKDYFGVLHIWSRDEYMKDLIEDVVADEFRRVLLGIDFNTAPDPLLAGGEKNPAFTGYSTLANQWGPHFWRRIYLEQMSPRKDSSLFEIERSRVDFNARVYPNF